MPNWCWNYLSIEGKKKDLDKFKKVLHRKDKLKVSVEKKNLEKSRKDYLLELKKNGSANRDMDSYIRIGTMDIKDFITDVKGLCFDEKGNACIEPDSHMLNRFHPMPTELKNTTSPCENNEVLKEKYGATNWYDWHCNNWGTKWDVNIDIQEESDNAIYMNFDSAWSPPVEWLRKVSKDYPKLHFELSYEEGGCAFKGVLEVCVDSGLFSDNCWEWYGDCGECDKDYTSEGHCDCVDENDKPLVWGEENEDEDDTEENPCAV